MHAQQELTDALKKRSVLPVILKGIAAAQYYDCPEARTYGDIDILITNEDTFNIAVSELQKFGYKPIKDYGELTFQANLACGSRHFEFKRKDVEVEIHSRYHEIAKVLKLYLNAKKWRKNRGISLSIRTILDRMKRK